MKRRAIILSAFLTFAIVGSAWAAGGQEGDFEIGPYGGYGFLSDYGTNNPKKNFLFGARVGYFLTPTVSFEPSYQVLITDTDRAAGANNNMQVRSLRFNLIYNFLPEKRIRPFVTGGLGWENTDIDNTVSANDLGTNLGAGLRIFITENIAARVDGRFVYTEVTGALDERQYNYEGALGFSYFFGGAPPADEDGDGVIDKKDTCANTPTGATVDAKGCPSDGDKDGVPDGIDQCPRTIEGLQVDEKGCMKDSDGDSVPDGPDQCPDTPQGVSVDSKGCPKDRDGDGVADSLDQCPKTPQGAPVDEKGCPIDTDGDGIGDHLDLCPDTEAGAQVDAKGCPKVSKARGVLKGVNFKVGSAKLTPESLVVLDGVAQTLQEFPKVRVEVQGHTDSSGKDSVNMQLSEKRAEAVKAYLIQKEVDPARLEAKGYGETTPIADNKTRSGRSKNRRVELKWLD